MAIQRLLIQGIFTFVSICFVYTSKAQTQPKIQSGFYLILNKSSTSTKMKNFHCEDYPLATYYISNQPVCTMKDVDSINIVMDTMFHSPVLSIVLSDMGAKKMAIVTKNNIGKKIGFVANGKLISTATATIMAEIPNGNILLTGRFSIDELKVLVEKMKKEIHFK